MKKLKNSMNIQYINYGRHNLLTYIFLNKNSNIAFDHFFLNVFFLSYTDVKYAYLIQYNTICIIQFKSLGIL